MARPTPSSPEYTATSLTEPSSPASSLAFRSPMTMTHHFISLSESAGQSRSSKGNGKGKDKGKAIVRGQRYSRRQSKKTCFDGMPREIKIHIFRYLSTFQLIRVSRVCRSWRGIAMDGSLWKAIDTTRFYKTIKDDQLRTLGTAASGFLRYANFRGCAQLSANSLCAIAEHCPNIERLNLMGCRSITSDAIADVCMNIPLLLHLDLGGLPSVNNHTLQTIAVYCRSIQTLNLAWCKQISGSGLTKLTRSCQELRKLNISGCSNLEDRWMPMIGMNLPKLRELCLNGCSSLTDRGLIGLLSGLSVASSKKHQKWRMKKRMGSSIRVSSLGHLLMNQSSCNDDDEEDDEEGIEEEEEEDIEKDEEESDRETDVDGEDADGNKASSNSANAPTPQTAPEGLQTRLVYLGLSHCNLLTQEALRAISHHCSRQLRRLELSNCENFGDEGLVHLAQHCTRIRLLDLEEVTTLTDVSLRAFAMYLPKLERICLSYCENVTDQGVMRMLRPASNPTTLSTTTTMMMNTEAASQYCAKLVHVELDNCLLITDRLLLEFANVLEERKAAALERQKERERKRQERRERMRQKKRREMATTPLPSTPLRQQQEPQSEVKSDQTGGEQEKDTQNMGSSSSVAINIPNRFRHIPALTSGSISSYSSSPLQPRSVLASTLLSEEVVVKKTRPGTRIMVPTRSTSTSSTSSSSSIPFWSSDIPSRRNTLNGKKGATITTTNGVRVARRPIRPTIQVFDCRNITLAGVEAAQTRSPSLVIRSYYSWSHPSTSAPATSALFGGSGATEGMDGEGGDADDDDDDDGDVDGINNNSSQTSLHHLQLQQQHLQQQLQRRSRAANLLQRARLGLVGHAGGGGSREGCTIL
ncbi:hypothetical protein BGZ58_007922 [Dissophora ornata]|nr:hypothetical protein BGZ58_007922 [Dissophora ornata]